MVTTNALDLVLPKAKANRSNKKHRRKHNKELSFFIDKEPVSETEFMKLLSLLQQINQKL
jgi:hypothetical protein